MSLSRNAPAMLWSCGATLWAEVLHFAATYQSLDVSKALWISRFKVSACTRLLEQLFDHTRGERRGSARMPDGQGITRAAKTRTMRRPPHAPPGVRTARQACVVSLLLALVLSSRSSSFLFSPPRLCYWRVWWCSCLCASCVVKRGEGCAGRGHTHMTHVVGRGYTGLFALLLPVCVLDYVLDGMCLMVFLIQGVLEMLHGMCAQVFVLRCLRSGV